jgi:hypothetical protein
LTHCVHEEELSQRVQLGWTVEQRTQFPPEGMREELTQAEHCCPLQALHAGCSCVHVKQPPLTRVRLLLLQAVHTVWLEQSWQLGSRSMQRRHEPLESV